MNILHEHPHLSFGLLEDRTLPSICGTTLSEEPLNLPGALYGQVAVVMLAFTSSAQSKLNSWLASLAPVLGEWAVPAYSVFLISDLPPFLKGMFCHHLRYMVPIEQHKQCAVSYGELDRYFTFFKPQNIKDAFCLLIDREGTIRFACEGYASPQSLKTLVKSVVALHQETGSAKS